MKILTAPNPCLRQKAEPIKTWTPKLQKQLEQMIQLLKASNDPQGMGLAATQVGINKRFFITLVKNRPQVFINPTISRVSTKMLSQKYKPGKKRPLEGCLSIPKLWGFVDRPYSVTLSYRTLNVKGLNPNIVNKIFKGLASISIQHERDHLDGILFTDRILKQSGVIYQETNGKLSPISL